MSKRDILKCDRCGTEASSDTEKKALDLHQVIFGTRRKYQSSYDPKEIPVYADHSVWESEWCLACREKTGIAVVMEQRKELPAEEVPTLESMIREIVRQELP